MTYPERVTVVEVGPRDGFQVEPTFIPTGLKIEVVDAIARAGVPKIETSSFVSPNAVPQLADAAEVFAGIDRRPGTRYSALVPNLKGVERALEVVPVRASDVGRFLGLSDQPQGLLRLLPLLVVQVIDDRPVQ